MSTGDVLELFRKRRTIRRFTDQDLSEALLDKVLDAASVAPSRLDRRPLHYIIIKDKATKSKIADALRVRPYIEQAPVVVGVAGDPRISPTWELDASAAIQNMLLAATCLGLGTAWVGSKGSTLWARAVGVLRETLAIPEHIDVVSLVCIGCRDEDKRAYEPGEKRDPYRLHYGHWDRLKL
jgi:nitroreductase